MAYSHTTWTQLQTALSLRLEDSSNIFWTATEIPLLLTEALRTYGVLSGFWRERGTVSLSSGTAFYDLPSLFSASGVINYTVTDRDIIQLVQFALLESASTQASWPGTAMYVYSDIVNAVTKRRDQFLLDSGVVLTRATQAVTASALQRETLADTIIDVRRAAWKNLANVTTPLWPEDERSLQLSDSSWAAAQSVPVAYAVLASPPVTLQLAPAAAANGTLDLITVSTGATLNPASSATVLGIPDDLTPAVKWGALADLLGNDGEGRDPVRAAFCEQRYQQYVMLARMLPLVVNAQLAGVSVTANNLQDFDSAIPDWQNSSSTPTDLAMAGWSLAAVNPVPNGTFTLTLDVVRKAPIPATGGTNVQIGREQLDALLDYAEHLALFKVGGAEFQATLRGAQNFLMSAILSNRRLGAIAQYVVAPKEESQREEKKRDRILVSDGVGAYPSGPGAERGGGGGAN